MSAAPVRVNLIFSLAPEASMDEAMRALTMAKVTINQPLAEIGMILGSGWLSQLDTLRTLSLFQSVDVQSTVQIAPPGDPIQ